MINPGPTTPVTDEDLKRLREHCEIAIKSGHVGITVIAQDMLRVITGFEQMRENLREMAKIVRGPGEALNQDDHC